MLSEFPEAVYDFPENLLYPEKADLGRYQTIVLVGDTPFFSSWINHAYRHLIAAKHEFHIAFIPDNIRESSIATNLQLPAKIEDQIELIKSQQTMHVDLIRCNFINREGVPANCLILNDALIGIPKVKLPLFFKVFVQWFRTSSALFPSKIAHKITLRENDEKIYEGSYIYSMLLLGNKITGGPRIYSKHRVFQKSFRYIQINPKPLTDYTFALPKIFSGKADKSKKDDDTILRRNFNDLDIQGIGQENEIIADGNHIGRLPASFTLLPNALRVISPRVSVPVRALWSEPVTSAVPISNS